MKSNLCDYNDAYILVRAHITATAALATQVLFTKSITKIDGTTIDDADNLDLVMQMYNLIEYSSNYSETTGRLWFYLNDEATNFNADIANTNTFKAMKHSC